MFSVACAFNFLDTLFGPFAMATFPVMRQRCSYRSQVNTLPGGFTRFLSRDRKHVYGMHTMHQEIRGQKFILEAKFKVVGRRRYTILEFLVGQRFMRKVSVEIHGVSVGKDAIIDDQCPVEFCFRILECIVYIRESVNFVFSIYEINAEGFNPVAVFFVLMQQFISGINHSGTCSTVFSAPPTRRDIHVRPFCNAKRSGAAFYLFFNTNSGRVYKWRLNFSILF